MEYVNQHQRESEDSVYNQGKSIVTKHHIQLEGALGVQRRCGKPRINHEGGMGWSSPLLDGALVDSLSVQCSTSRMTRGPNSHFPIPHTMVQTPHAGVCLQIVNYLHFINCI